MKYLLDTCVISELVRPFPDSGVTAWFSRIPSENLFLCSLTIGEVRKGLIKLPESRKKRRLTEWLDTLLEHYQDRIYSIDISVAENWGVLQGKAEKEGVPMPSIDGLIAAVAYTHHCILVTRNTDDFQMSGVLLLNPWNGKAK